MKREKGRRRKKEIYVTSPRQFMLTTRNTGVNHSRRSEDLYVRLIASAYNSPRAFLPSFSRSNASRDRPKALNTFLFTDGNEAST
jgi:hypothetical protein